MARVVVQLLVLLGLGRWYNRCRAACAGEARSEIQRLVPQPKALQNSSVLEALQNWGVEFMEVGRNINTALNFLGEGWNNDVLKYPLPFDFGGILGPCVLKQREGCSFSFITVICNYGMFSILVFYLRTKTMIYILAVYFFLGKIKVHSWLPSYGWSVPEICGPDVSFWFLNQQGGYCSVPEAF